MVVSSANIRAWLRDAEAAMLSKGWNLSVEITSKYKIDLRGIGSINNGNDGASKALDLGTIPFSYALGIGVYKHNIYGRCSDNGARGSNHRGEPQLVRKAARSRFMTFR